MTYASISHVMQSILEARRFLEASAREQAILLQTQVYTADDLCTFFNQESVLITTDLIHARSVRKSRND